MAAHAAAPVRRSLGRPFAAGHDPRRSAGGRSRAERDFNEALEAEHIPKASALLAKVYAQAMKDLPKGKTATAELFFKVCGLVKKPTDDERINGLVMERFEEAIAEARRQRQLGASQGSGTRSIEPPGR
jgi:hypothetical protein